MVLELTKLNATVLNGMKGGRKGESAVNRRAAAGLPVGEAGEGHTGAGIHRVQNPTLCLFLCMFVYLCQNEFCVRCVDELFKPLCFQGESG